VVAEDYIDLLDPFEIQNEDGIECKYCGVDHLEWREGRGSRNNKIWQLVDGRGEIHNCRRAVADVNDFPIL
jgi:hypothetical protein